MWIEERVATLEEQMRALARDLGELEPRLEHVERDAAAAKVAKATLDAQRQERLAAGARLDRRAGVVLAAVVAGTQGVFFGLDRMLG